MNNVILIIIVAVIVIIAALIIIVVVNSSLRNMASMMQLSQDQLRNGTTDQIRQFQVSNLEQMKQMQNNTTEQIRQLQMNTTGQIKQFQDTTTGQIRQFQNITSEQINRMKNDNVTQMGLVFKANTDQVKLLTESNTKQLEEMKQSISESMESIKNETEKKLNEIRGTVDEKLQTTLEKRISESFKSVSDQLEQVYRGLGEMQTLANDVGGLKKVLAGVKTRGILGEVQLQAILEDILAPGQYDTNVATIPGSSDRVEFAVKLPGSDDESVIYLPIDAKFPGDRFAALRDAQDTGDKVLIEQAYKALENVIKQEAKDIHDKYVQPPYTTNFAIMFLPFEGLYAEVVNRGLVEDLQQKFRINVAGPSTMAALLNSLQMGFKTLAIQKRSNEVWEVLAAVKTEFGTFEAALTKMQTHLNQTSNDLEHIIGTRTRAINRKLKNIQTLDLESVNKIFEIESYNGVEE